MSGSTYPHPLPHALSAFIGRSREIADVKRRLESARLVTLTGPGGCGKTRLALRAVDDLVGQFPNGIWLTELASLANPGLVPQAVAAALDVREQPGTSLVEMLIAHLETRECLIVLDNCEHLIGACALLVEALLARCPGLRILATSREPLTVTGEQVWSVPPLTLPELQPWLGPAHSGPAMTTYEQSEAIQLFVARAAAITPDFALTPQNGLWIADVCRQLDGMPLAIELAAARTRVLSVRQIAERLHDRFGLLTGGSRTASPRQQTLAATLDWSHALLSTAEQIVLRRLPIFAGGFTLEAAEAVCDAEDMQAVGVLDGLARLVDKSLLMAAELDGDARYRLLETIRQYAHVKLVEADEETTIRDRHLSYFLKWAETAEPHLHEAEQINWLTRYEIEHDNLRAALAWSRAHGSAEAGLRLAAACGRFWRVHGHVSEGRDHLSAVLSHPDVQARTQPRARALTFLANLAYLQSDYPAMHPVADEALSIWRELGLTGRSGLAYTLDLVGELATEEGDYAHAPAYFQEALQIYRELGDIRGASDIPMQFGWAAMRLGDYAQATVYLEEFLELAQAANDITNIAFACSGLGEVAIRQGDYVRAESLLNQSLSLNRSRGDQWGVGTVLGSLGWVALRRRDFKIMRAYLTESLTVRLKLRDRGGIAWCLEKLAQAAWLLGEAASPVERAGHGRLAVAALGSAAAIRAPIRSVVDPVDQPEHDRLIADLRQALGDEAFDKAWATGQAQSIDGAVAEALLLLEMPAVATEAPRSDGARLTAREREVSRLLAQGKTNREIAQAMTVGVKTVETYVTRILNKLGFDTRLQIALWEREQAPRSETPPDLGD